MRIESLTFCKTLVSHFPIFIFYREEPLVKINSICVNTFTTFTRDILLLDISRISNLTSCDSVPLDISVNRLPLISNSLSDVKLWNKLLGSSLRRFSSSVRRVRLIVSLKIGTGNSDRRFLPSSNSSRFQRPRNASRDKDEMRLEERSSRTKKLLLRNRPSGKVRSLFDDKSLKSGKIRDYIGLWSRKRKLWRQFDER